MAAARRNPELRRDRARSCARRRPSACAAIRLTGGEPLVRRDLEPPRGGDRRDTRASTTSRSRPTDCCSKTQLAGLVAAGLRAHQSLARHAARRPLRGDRAPAGARRGAARDRRGDRAPGLTPVKLNCVVMRGQNDDEIADFAAADARAADLRALHRGHAGARERRTAARRLRLIATKSWRGSRRSASCVPVAGPAGNGPARYFAFAGRARRRRRDQPALARLLRTLQPRAPDRGRPAAALPLRRSRDRSAHPAARRRRHREELADAHALGDADQAASATICASARRPRGCGPSRRSAAKGAVTAVTGPWRRREAVSGERTGWTAYHAGGSDGDRAGARRSRSCSSTRRSWRDIFVAWSAMPRSALDLTQDVFLSAYRMLKRGSAARADAPAGSIARRRTPRSRSCAGERSCGASARPRGRSQHWRIDERSAASIDLQAALGACRRNSPRRC